MSAINTHGRFAYMMSGIFVLLLLVMTAQALRVSATDAITDNSKIDTVKLDEFIERERSLNRIPGMSVAITDKDRVIYTYSYGKQSDGNNIDTQTPFLLASTTKPITALLLLTVLEAKGIPVQARVSEYVKDFAGSNLRFKDLLQHTSGLQTSAYNPNDSTLEQTAKSLISNTQSNQPYEYSSANYQLIGALIENISGQSYESYAEQTLWKPLGMTNTYTARKTSSSPRAVGHQYWFGRPLPSGLSYATNGIANGFTFSSSNDMASFLRLQLNDGMDSKGKSIVSENTVKSMTAYAVDVPEESYKMGLGWRKGQIAGQQALFHGGQWVDGLTELVILPEKGVGIVVLSNAAFMFEPDATERMADGIAAIINGSSIPESRSGKLGVVSAAIILIALLLIANVVSTIVKFVRYIKRKEYKNEHLSQILKSAGVKFLVIMGIVAVSEVTFMSITRLPLALPDLAAVLGLVLSIELAIGVIKVAMIWLASTHFARKLK